MVALFSQLLLKKPTGGQFYIEGPRFGRVRIDYKPFGAASALILWLRDGQAGQPPQAKAVSIMMGNADPEADTKALATLRRLKAPLAYPAKAFEEIAADPRPMVGTLFFDRDSFKEDIFVIAAECFAAAFFIPLAQMKQRPAKKPVRSPAAAPSRKRPPKAK